MLNIFSCCRVRRFGPARLGLALAVLPAAEAAVTDDARPALTVSFPDNGRVTEGTGGTTKVPVTISISTSHHTGASLKLRRRGSARAGAACTGQVDLIATSDIIGVSWLPGDGADKTVMVVICGDSRDEDTDTIELTTVAVVDADIAPGSASRLVIFDDDPPPGLSVQDLTVVEGAPAQVNIVLSAASDLPVEVLLTAAAGTPTSSGTAATAGEACAGTVDFLSVSRRVTVPAGKTTASIEITTCSNVDFGTNPATLPGPGYSETFLVTASAPTHATLTKAVGVVTVRDP